MTELLCWLSGLGFGFALGAAFWARRVRRFQHECMRLATEQFDALVEEWRRENRREERLGR